MGDAVGHENRCVIRWVRGSFLKTGYRRIRRRPCSICVSAEALRYQEAILKNKVACNKVVGVGNRVDVNRGVV